MVKIDMWYEDNYKDCDKISVNFYDADSTYRGNIYKNGKCIGDYVATDSVELENKFSHLKFNWD